MKRYDTLIEALTAFTVSFSFVDRQTDKSKDQAPKQHHYLGRKNDYFFRIDPEHLPNLYIRCYNTTFAFLLFQLLDY